VPKGRGGEKTLSGGKGGRPKVVKSIAPTAQNREDYLGGKRSPKKYRERVIMILGRSDGGRGQNPRPHEEEG